MKRTLLAIALLSATGLTFAQADNSSGTVRSNRSDPSQMTTPPAGAEPSDIRRGDDRRLDNRSSTTTRNSNDRRANNNRSGMGEPADPSQMTTQPEGAAPTPGRP